MEWFKVEAALSNEFGGEEGGFFFQSHLIPREAHSPFNNAVKFTGLIGAPFTGRIICLRNALKLT